MSCILLWFRGGVNTFFMLKREGIKCNNSLVSTTGEWNKDNMQITNSRQCSLYGCLMVMIWWAGLGKIPVLAFIRTSSMALCYTPPGSTSGKSVQEWSCDTSFLIGNGHCTTVLAACAVRLQSVSRRYNVQVLMPPHIFGYTFYQTI